MPIYEYRCRECEQIFEEWQKDFETRSVACPVCGAKSERLMSNTSFVLKGSGWYVTDYCRGSGSSKNSGAAADPGTAKPAASDAAETKSCASCPSATADSTTA